MKLLSQRAVIISFRMYLIAALVASAIMSPSALSVIMVIPVVAYILLWWLNRFHQAFLVLEYFIYYTIAILFSQNMSPFLSILFSVPILFLFTRDLEASAILTNIHMSEQKRRATPVGLALILTTAIILGFGILLLDMELLITSSLGLIYLGVLGAIAFIQMPKQPVIAEQLTLHLVAGSQSINNVALTLQTNLGARVLLDSPYEWVKITEPQFSLIANNLVSEIDITPPLSGPSVISLNGTIVDRWGIIQTRFEIEPFVINVIPRARYAEWLAKQYLEGSKSGILPLMSSISIIKPSYGLRRGIEYYGSQLYQPGDNLKNIDWKHSVKYNRLIIKEFADFHEQEAIMLINLSVGDEEESDKQAYNIMTTAISLAKEQIPTAIAAYNDEDTIKVTNILRPNQLISQAMEISSKIELTQIPRKYLAQPDILRLRANIHRIQNSTNPSTQKLAELLKIEYTNLRNISQNHPATKTLSSVINKVSRQTSVVIISQSNHDAEAIEFYRDTIINKGGSIITI